MLEPSDEELTVAWETEGPVEAHEQEHLDAARARVLAFAKDQALLDWLDEPELERAWDSATRLLEQRGERVEEVVERAARNIDAARSEQMIGDLERSTGANKIIDGTTSPPSSGTVHGVGDVLGVTDLSLAADSQGHGATPGFVAGAGGGGSDANVGPSGALQSNHVGASSGEVLEGGDANARDRDTRTTVHEPAPLVRVTGGALGPLEQNRFDPTQLVEHFYASLSEQTRAGYSFDLGKFAEWRSIARGLDVTTGAAVAELVAGGPGRANQQVLEWMTRMREQGLSPATRNRRLAAVKSVLRFARLVGSITWTIDVRGARVEKFRDTRGPGVEAVSHILATCSDDLAGKRDRAMLLLATVNGLRRREIAAARVSDVDVERRRMWVRGKGEKDSWVTLPPEVLESVVQWLKAWQSTTKDALDGALFRSLSNRTFGNAISRKGVYEAVVAAGKRAGIKVWTHGLRHTSVTAALDETNGNIRAAQAHGRHSDPRVTMRYDDNRVDLAGDVAKKIAKKLV